MSHPTEPADVTVRRAEKGDVSRVAELFDAYRVFYGQNSDETAAERFIAERLDKGDSAIFVAEVGGRVEGFAQMYPSLSSVAMGKIWVLNDILVSEDARHHGVAGALLERAHDFAREGGASRLTVSTARDNRAAIALYEKHGWKPDEFFLHYYRVAQ